MATPAQICNYKLCSWSYVIAVFYFQVYQRFKTYESRARPLGVGNGWLIENNKFLELSLGVFFFFFGALPMHHCINTSSP